MKKNWLTNKEMAELSGLTPRTVHLYTESGMIVPEIDNPTGRGTTRKYSKKNLVELILIKDLTLNCLSLKKIKVIFDIMKKNNISYKLDPEGKWGWEERNLKSRLIIYDLWKEEPTVQIEAEPVRREITDYKSKLTLNLEDIFIHVDQN